MPETVVQAPRSRQFSLKYIIFLMATLVLSIGRQFFQHTVNFGADQTSFALPPTENHKAFDFEHLCKLD